MAVQETFFERFFSLEGRMNRKRYFFSILIIFVISFFGGAIDGFVQGAQGRASSADEYQASIYLGVFVLFMLYPNAVVIAKRLHDLGFKGIFAVVLVVLFNGMPLLDMFGMVNKEDYLVLNIATGIIGFIIGLFLLFKKGTVGQNQYGPDPLENSLSSAVSQSGVSNEQPKAYAAFSEDMFEESVQEQHSSSSDFGEENSDEDNQN